MKTITRAKTALTGALAAAVVVVAACSEGSEGTKAGSDDRPVTLRLATVDPPGRPASDDVEQFARQVEELSDGALLVEILWEAHETAIGTNQPGAYRTLADMARDGDADLGLVPDFVWRDLGVTSLIALRAPFLITTDELVQEVVTSELADQMLAGLDAADVVGLALLPETLRHPVGFAGPFLTPDDFAGAALRTLEDASSEELLRALGAEAAFLDGEPFVRAVAEGEVLGADSAFAQHGSLPAPGTFTGNITFYPKMNVLVANAAVFEGLDDSQQAILRDAAAHTLRYVLDTNPSDAESAQEWCDIGGGIALATEADVAAIEREAEPVYAELELDEQTRSFIAEIRTMKEAAGPPVASIEQCDVVVPPVLEAGEDDPSVLNGVYRVEITEADLLAGGVTNPDDLAINQGVFTWTLRDGTWSLDQRFDDFTDHIDGTYTIDGDTVVFTTLEFKAPLNWEIADDGSLHFTDPPDLFNHPILAVLYAAHPWTRIDDL